jgi:hypothetical protein
MKQTQVLEKLQAVKGAVKKSLREKGVVVPVKTSRGLRLDDFEIVEDVTGFTILDKWKEKQYSKLYFMQTAVVIANALALNKQVKQEWVIHDAIAGSADFDLKVFDKRYQSSVKKKDGFGIDYYSTRIFETKLKFKSHIEELNSAYSRLVNSVKSLDKNNKY